MIPGYGPDPSTAPEGVGVPSSHLSITPAREEELGRLREAGEV
jgi:hypothetical protein